ncbi:hypothetical protein BLA24_25460 [Streptomyces cinnamoneus]|uniref:Integral membrane protein n=1 Tax=Streptomyces cinnamoneus TaxID=53446 RepID=A0A2G1XDW3_STRCJ|nr:DUF6113 family protein [Streptomyces cinnamoneus]PHQ49395.1 hypothetical protein BLA24_25460 [Streptomyces cinnamoneus]PPT14955.1 hypothetical protein CYQ11_20615 [Streptomyces cinnamoneus]
MNGGLISMPSAGRLVAYVGLVLLGLLVGAAGSLVQGGWFPGGLLLALLAVAGLCYGGLKVMGSRAGGGVPAVGWLAAVLFLAANRPEGDFLFEAGIGSYVFLLGGAIVAVICATIPKVPQPAGPPARLGK